ncbi:hypothetical protein [Leifsonia sp. EB34]|uniref:hypothetical protein n=1 Tax=Leifsonia sp. EB34 TaxID=3156303 RepID=UPI0035125F3D
MSISQIVLTVMLLAGGAFALIAATRLLPGVARRAAALVDARRQRIRGNPGDHARITARIQLPSRLRSQQKISAAQSAQSEAEARVDRIRAGFPHGTEPGWSVKIFTLAMLAVWLVAITAAAVLDWPIIKSVSGGNGLYALVGVLVFMCWPFVAALVLEQLVNRWRTRLGPLVFAGAVIAVLAAVVIVIAILATLAPIRAQIEYAEQLTTARHQLVKYQDDGDQTAVATEKSLIAQLTAQERQSAAFNQILVPLAAGVETASGYFLLPALHLLQLEAARGAAYRTRRLAAAAQNRHNVREARMLRRLGRAFRSAGLTQQDLDRQLEPAPAAAVATGTLDPVAMPSGVPDAASTMTVPATPASTAGGPVQPVGPEATGRAPSASRTPGRPIVQPSPQPEAEPIAGPAPERLDDSFDILQ